VSISQVAGVSETTKSSSVVDALHIAEIAGISEVTSVRETARPRVSWMPWTFLRS
jgi:hypothetical protein